MTPWYCSRAPRTEAVFRCDQLLLLQPTSPLRSSADMKESLHFNAGANAHQRCLYVQAASTLNGAIA